MLNRKLLTVCGEVDMFIFATIHFSFDIKTSLILSITLNVISCKIKFIYNKMSLDQYINIF